MRINGVLYEALSAVRDRRRRQALYHSALRVLTPDGVHVIEMGPVWSQAAPAGAVVAQGPVGLGLLGRSRLFRYEVRCWLDGTIPDLDAAVDSPRWVSTDGATAQRVLALVRRCPVLTWGRDELGTGEMWNSNSLISWLLAGSGHDLDVIAPPAGGRAPGWRAGRVAATRQDLSA